jgi:hypothetical protein
LLLCLWLLVHLLWVRLLLIRGVLLVSASCPTRGVIHVEGFLNGQDVGKITKADVFFVLCKRSNVTGESEVFGSMAVLYISDRNRKRLSIASRQIAITASVL